MCLILNQFDPQLVLFYVRHLSRTRKVGITGNQN